MRAGGKSGESAKGVLIHVLKNVLKLLHPFMPFVTEEIYSALPGTDELLITSQWPAYDAALDFPAEMAMTEALMERIRAIRNRRSEMNVAPSKKAHLTVLTENQPLYEINGAHFEKLASVSEISFISDVSEIDESKMTVIICGGDKLYIPTGELVDFAKELERLRASYAKQSAELEKLNARLGNENFVKRAPANLVAQEQARAAALTEALETIASSIAGIESKL